MYFYKEGFHKLDGLSPVDLESLNNIRRQEIERFMSLQVALSSIGNISIEATNEMSPFELNNMFELVKKKTELENKRNSET